jgi:hypothetical protein
VRARLLACLAIAALGVLVASAGPARAQAGACPPPPYPGDAASREAIAHWMAYNAALVALPRELPVMAALVESELTNLQTPGSDSQGFFQMRLSIWGAGPYAGFPQRPDLQLQWFVDQAAQVRQARIAAGAPDPAAAEASWGDWVADVERPAESLRGRYALRLPDARALIGAACAPAPAPGAVVAPVAAATDTTPPATTAGGHRRQRALHRGAIVIDVGCPAEDCSAAGFATLRLPRARRPPLILSRRVTIAAGTRRLLRFELRGQVRRRVRKALRERAAVAVTVRIRVSDLAGNATPRTSTVRITG